MSKDNLLNKLVKIFTKTKNVFIGIVVEWSSTDGVLLVGPNSEYCRILSIADIEAYTFVGDEINNEKRNSEENKTKQELKEAKDDTLIKQDDIIPIQPNKRINLDTCSLLQLRKLKAEAELQQCRTLLNKNQTTNEGVEYGTQFSALQQFKNNLGK